MSFVLVSIVDASIYDDIAMPLSVAQISQINHQSDDEFVIINQGDNGFEIINVDDSESTYEGDNENDDGFELAYEELDGFELVQLPLFDNEDYCVVDF